MEKSLSLGSDRLIENFIHRDLTRLSQLQRFIDLHQIHCIRNDQRAAACSAAGVVLIELNSHIIADIVQTVMFQIRIYFAA